MVGHTGGGVSVGGGGGEGGGITPNYLAQNYVGILYWNQLFTIHGKQTTTVDGTVTDEQDITLPPNSMPSRTETTEGGVTTVVETTITRIEALFDFNSVGGVSALGYNPGGGGGGDTLNEPLASINNASLGMPTAAGQVITWNGTQWIFDIPEGGGGGGTGTVTSITAGTGLSGGTITTMGTIAISSTYQGYITHGETAYGWGNHANAGYLTQSSLNGYATQNWVTNQGYATQTWVTGRGYITSAALSGYATQAWVNNQGFLTEDQYKGTVTSVKMTVPTGFSISGSPITSSGTLALGFTNGYSLPTTAKQSNWDTAYSWGNHANAGYMLRTEGMKFEARTGYLAARLVLADGSTYDSTRAALAQGSGYIEWWSTGGFFNHWMGNVIIGQDATDSTHYLQIGGGRIYWDNQSKSLYVVQADGSTAANFYATGGVSALGISTGGSPSVSALTVGTLNVTSYADISNLTLQSDMNANSCNIEMEGGNITDVGDLTTSTINVNGTTIKRIYWNGTYLQVQIGSSTYNFKPV
jgi:hypothetical protein